ncbi:MAG: hypothetical protein GF383_04525 [Candidatus Lokiarchaeota archaeon]|nr:hypothetical protein [Candidatus Lokiarchaeota archaeon]MBD3339050.1 hypothetical protein [Candidatus Lokiarchaeota archaeon]
MSELTTNLSLTPKKIREAYVNGKFSKAEAEDRLISLMEISESDKIRAQCINKLNEIDAKNDKLFKLLESILISDSSPHVRSAAVKLLLKSFLKKSSQALLWVVRRDKSPLVLNPIIEFFEKNPSLLSDSLKQEINEILTKFAQIMGIVVDEIKFFLDIEILFALGKTNYEINLEFYNYLKLFEDIKYKNKWISINGSGRVEALTYDCQAWRYLKEGGPSITSVLNLEYPSLYLSTIIDYSDDLDGKIFVPKSITYLSKLKLLNLSSNNLSNVPDSIGNLVDLKILDLSRNQLEKIPKSFSNLKNIRVLNLSYNNLKNLPDFITKWQSLSELRLKENKFKNLSPIVENLSKKLDVLKI